MNEIVFSVEVDEDGGYVAVSKLENGAIVTQGDTLPELNYVIADAIKGYFFDRPEQRPETVRLQPSSVGQTLNFCSMKTYRIILQPEKLT